MLVKRSVILSPHWFTASESSDRPDSENEGPNKQNDVNPRRPVPLVALSNAQAGEHSENEPDCEHSQQYLDEEAGNPTNGSHATTVDHGRMSGRTSPVPGGSGGCLSVFRILVSFRNHEGR